MPEFSSTIEYNRLAWNKQVENRVRWTVPVTPEEIAEARTGDLKLILTPNRLVPKDWFPQLRHLKTLALASGGGQQGPLLAAAGAEVTILDLSDKQLEQDQAVAKRENLNLKTVQGQAAQLPFDAESFDLIVNPCSLCFFPEIRPVWKECARVLKPGGIIMTGFSNPVTYTFDFERANKGEFVMRYHLPFSDDTSLSQVERDRFLHPGEPREFSHTLTDIIGGLLEVGIVIDRFFEDYWDTEEPINQYFPPFMALRGFKAIK